MRTILGATGFAVTLAVMSGHGQAPTPRAESSDTLPFTPGALPGLWFVELASPPVIEGTAASTLEREEAGFHAAASGAGVRYAESRHFRDLWNGLTVRAAVDQVARLRALANVRAVYPVLIVSPKQQEGPAPTVPEMITALKMTGADIAHNELGLSGRGVTVAVIDSGVDYDHPDLGGCFGPGCRVAKGFDFVGDAFNLNPASPAYSPTPVPDPHPDDCGGHGTHVAGIIGANGTITGAAPEVTFHAYRVLGCSGPTSDDIVLAAMERAWRDGADVINASLGSAYGWPQSPSGQAASRLARRGVVVVSAAGNEGADGLYGSAAPGIGHQVIGVASYDNTETNLASFKVAPDARPVGYNALTGAPPPPLSGTFPLARTGSVDSTDDACAALPADSLTDRIALIRRGTCAFSVKAANAQAAGASGVVFYNNVTGRISGTVVGTTPIVIPVVSITDDDGGVIDERLASGAVTLTWSSDVVSEPLATGNLISSFSSYGPAPDLTIKPDLGAPGGAVRSTLPLELGGFGSQGGTSMASPHVAGAVALLLEAWPGLRPDDVMRRLQNTAQPHLWSGNPTLGMLDLVHRQGAGMLAVDRAIFADAEVSPSRLSLGEFEYGATVARRLVLSALRKRHVRRAQRGRHDDDSPVTYTLGHAPALATGANTFALSVIDAFATVRFGSPTAVLGDRRDGGRPGGRDELGGEGGRWSDADRDSVWVTFTAPAHPNARVFGGYITLTPDDGGEVLRVPYLGYNGDYQQIVALTPTPFGFPWLAKAVGNNLVNQPTGATFTLTGTDLPFVLYHLEHQVRQLKIEAFDAATNQSVGFVDHERFAPRNGSATAFFGLIWDGTAAKWPNKPPTELPNGTYRLELSVLKALGDRWNPAHYEHWLSPDITITRPAPVDP